jgi:putative transposase
MKTTMIALFRKLLCMLHDSRISQLEMENEYLKCENEIMRRNLGNRVRLTEAERRRLVELGMPIRDRLNEIMSIVKPETLLAWHRRMKKEKWKYDNTPKHPGRSKIGKDAEELILRMARENTWGYRRIAGELRKLGYNVSHGCVRDVLKRNRLNPSPHHNKLTWKKFIRAHAETIWAADFFTEEVWTRCGLTTFYVLFFIHIRTRRICIAGATPKSKAAWVRRKRNDFINLLDENELLCKRVIHDRDSSLFALDEVLKKRGIEIIKTPPRAPKCNAYAERFVREARETLDNLILIGSGHLHRTLKIIEQHHNECRPHQGINNNIPLGYQYPENPNSIEKVRRRSRLGGLLNHYYSDDLAA